MPGRELGWLRILKRCSFVIMGIALIMVMIGFSKLHGSKLDKVAAADKQWQSVLALAERASEGRLHATVKWQGSWESLLDPGEAADVLSTRLGLSSPTENAVQGHSVYIAQGSNGGINAKLSVMPEEGGTSYYVILLMEGDARVNAAHFSELQTTYGYSLQDEGVDVNWNTALQGSVASGLSGGLEVEGASLQELLNKLEQQAASTLQLQLYSADEYVDEESQTVSRSYEAHEMPIYVNSGEHQIALQMAVHYNEDSGEREISMGSPLLTVEY
ncbi:hypothetical protein GCM10010913_23270 [Paenibacillus aceti]|uniref:TATA-box binding protein n=2 Tax=Paenibacillus aceti TaxID=1820010 RepID=A0ABQ1VWG4_9BACL|nr:YwmB family TATA-box binding protein [Paenibacillus aceti]GGG00921.1 hypothetical protein GCM10010913_23270 [Paenibacillus aceti]